MHTHDFVLYIVLMPVVTPNKINCLKGNFTYDVKYANYYMVITYIYLYKYLRYNNNIKAIYNKRRAVLYTHTAVMNWQGIVRYHIAVS